MPTLARIFGTLRPHRALGLLLVALSPTAVTQPARADAGACMNLHASGQREMKAGRMKLASQQFMQCASDDSCPAAVRGECMTLFETVERTTPSVIFSVVDDQGSDVTNVVRVFSGDTLLMETLDGRAVPVDPGKHQFRFELPWGQVVHTDVLIREGEKNRVVSIKVEDPNKPAARPEPEVPGIGATDGPPPPVARSRTPPGFWIASGLGVAALGTGAVFTIMGRGKHSDLADCSPNCDPARKDDYDALKRDYLIGDIALGVGVVSAGVAAVIYFTGGSSSSEAADSAKARRAPRLSLVPGVSNHGATLTLSGTTF